MKKVWIFIILFSITLFVVSCRNLNEDINDEDPDTLEPNPDPHDPNDPNDPEEPIDPEEPNIPNELEDRYVVYINIDGFAKYYYDEAVNNNLVPNLLGYVNEGILFENLYTLLPSITNPVQNMIISGADSSVTHNVYRYYDKTNNIVIQQQRENDAETIYHVLKTKNIKAATVRHFLAEDVFSPTNPNYLYIREPLGAVADAVVRFDQAIKLVKGENLQNYTTFMMVDEVPRFLSVYVDDLDALGHNEVDVYGYKKATSETERMSNVLDRLQIIDTKIKELVDAYKARDLYDKTVFLITTDHGMTPFGAEEMGISSLLNKYSKPRWPDLANKLKTIDSSYSFQYLSPGEGALSSINVIGVSAGLNMALTFKTVKPIAELEEIADILKAEAYVEDVLTRNELIRMGFWRNANVDLLVVPSERYHFHGRTNPNGIYAVRGQHDSYHMTSRNIFGLVFGGSVQNKGIVQDEVYVHSFGVMIADALNVVLKDANAPRINYLKEED